MSTPFNAPVLRTGAPRKTERLSASRVMWRFPAPTVCDGCGLPLVGMFHDCRTPSGAWGIFCRPCVLRAGLKLGLGHGQAYKLDTLEKVAG